MTLKIFEEVIYVTNYSKCLIRDQRLSLIKQLFEKIIVLQNFILFASSHPPYGYLRKLNIINFMKYAIDEFDDIAWKLYYTIDIRKMFCDLSLRTIRVVMNQIDNLIARTRNV
jgi:hypothetical protein